MGDPLLPEELADELRKNKQAADIYQQMPPSHQRQYALWVDEAKTPKTRIKRAHKSIAMILAWGKNL